MEESVFSLELLFLNSSRHKKEKVTEAELTEEDIKEENGKAELRKEMELRTEEKQEYYELTEEISCFLPGIIAEQNFLN